MPLILIFSILLSWMKRLGASLLLWIFVLNIFGYYGVFIGARIQAAQKIQASFDVDDYQSNSEITFKVPVTLPYASDMSEYQRVDGEFNYHGDVYRLIKQKFVKDALFIVCVKDAQSKKIDRALEDYVKTFADNPSGEKNHSKGAPSVNKDYFSISIALEKTQLGWEYLLQWPEIHQGKITSFLRPIIQPPRA